MGFSLVDVAGANFRTEEGADAVNTQFMSYLGVRARYMPARLAIARSLAVSSAPEFVSLDADQGKAIKGDTLFGTGADLAAWVTLITQRAGRGDLNLKDLIALVSAHWRRGLELLEEEWTQSDHDLARFIRRLVDAAGIPTVAHSADKDPETTIAEIAASLISIRIGEVATDSTTGELVEWKLNATGGSPHSAIMGGVGSGKTRTAVTMLRSIRDQAPVPLLAFDFKGDLAGDPSQSYRLDSIFNAAVLQPPRQPIPLDVLAVKSKDLLDIAYAAERFRESFGRLKGNKLGDRQRDAVFEAAQRALRIHSPCKLSDVLDALINVYQDRGMREDGAVSTLRDLCRFPLFEPTQRPAEFFQKSWVIRLPSDVPETSRGIVVNLLLDALDQFLNSLPDSGKDEEGNRALRSVCVIDEAHRILGSRLPSLSSLIRMSRSKGGSVMLISQSPDDFSGEDDEFLSEMGLIAAFGTNAKPTAVSRIFGSKINLAGLPTGECLVKRRGEQAFRRVQAWIP